MTRIDQIQQSPACVTFIYQRCNDKKKSNYKGQHQIVLKIMVTMFTFFRIDLINTLNDQRQNIDIVKCYFFALVIRI